MQCSLISTVMVQYYVSNVLLFCHTHSPCCALGYIHVGLIFVMFDILPTVENRGISDPLFMRLSVILIGQNEPLNKGHIETITYIQQFCPL